jgi:hypothetical protein
MWTFPRSIFIEYSAHEEYGDLGIEKEGEDFFALSRKNIVRVAHPDDLAGSWAPLTRKNILRETEQNKTFTINYRLMFNGVPTYVSMKATRMGEDI